MYLESDIWAIKQNALMLLLGRYDALIQSGKEIPVLVAKRSTGFSRVRGSIAVVPIDGIITQKPTFWGAIFGDETSTEQLTADIAALVADSTVDAIILDVNSPGGSVYGVAEAARAIYGMRGTKPIIAAVNSLSASAAYWLSAAADEIVITPSGEAGSIGVVAVHYDLSAAEENFGLKTTFIHAGKYKVEGNQSEPLGDEARAAIQGRVDDYYNMFLGDLAKFRSRTVPYIKSNFGQGRVFGADDAKAAGMVDRIATEANLIADLRPKGKGQAVNRAQLKLAHC
jgi:signal peptide peptidase SppA